jgi:hypothetical protein
MHAYIYPSVSTFHACVRAYVLLPPPLALQDDWLRTTGFEGFKVLSSRVLLGKGPDVYARAKRKIATWGLNDSVGWVKFIEGEDGEGLKCACAYVCFCRNERLFCWV